MNTLPTDSWLSSTEIAALIGRSHDSVLADLEDFASSGRLPENTWRRVDYPYLKYNIPRKIFINISVIGLFAERYPPNLRDRLNRRGAEILAAETLFNEARKESKRGYLDMSAALQEYTIIHEPESANSLDYMEEARLIRFVFQGTYDPIERDYANAADLFLLSRLEDMNAVLILLGESRKARQYTLRNYAIKMKAVAEKLAYISKVFGGAIFSGQ